LAAIAPAITLSTCTQSTSSPSTLRTASTSGMPASCSAAAMRLLVVAVARMMPER
jgi:hypothetical protein